MYGNGNGRGTSSLSNEFREGIIPKGAALIFNMIKMNIDDRNWGTSANTYYPDPRVFPKCIHTRRWHSAAVRKIVLRSNLHDVRLKLFWHIYCDAKNLPPV